MTSCFTLVEMAALGAAAAGESGFLKVESLCPRYPSKANGFRSGVKPFVGAGAQVLEKYGFFARAAQKKAAPTGPPCHLQWLQGSASAPSDDRVDVAVPATGGARV